MTTEVTPYREQLGALTPHDVREQVNLIQLVMKEVMKKDEHYGVIPGTGTKPTLLKAGAEKLCLTFRLAPSYEVVKTREGQHIDIDSTCTLLHIPSGKVFGQGMGSCSTRESKYAYRKAVRKCPNCGAEAIIKGKDFKGDGKPTGWVCFAKRGGCGTKFQDGDQAVEGQALGRTANEDLADQYNTVLKMANKRSLIAAVLNATAASDIFTQDLDEDITLEMDGSKSAAPQASPSATGASSGASPAAAADLYLNPDEVVALESMLSAERKAKLLANVSKRYKTPVTRLSQIKAEDYQDAKAFAEAA